MTELSELWTQAWQQLLGKARHELRGALNGVAVNLEVVRSRVSAGKTDREALQPFVDAVSDQFQDVTARTQAVMFLAGLKVDGADDVAKTLGHLAQLLVSAARADGTSLVVEGYDRSAPTSASPAAIRLALATGLMALIKEGGGICRLTHGREPVVRFSHQSASACSLGPEVTHTVRGHRIRIQESDGELTLVFPN